MGKKSKKELPINEDVRKTLCFDESTNFIRKLTLEDVYNFDKKMFISNGRIKEEFGHIVDEDVNERLFDFNPVIIKEFEFDNKNAYQENCHSNIRKVIKDMLEEKLNIKIDLSSILIDWNFQPDESKTEFTIIKTNRKCKIDDSDEIVNCSFFKNWADLKSFEESKALHEFIVEMEYTEKDYNKDIRSNFIENLFGYDAHIIPLNYKRLISDDSKTINDAIFWYRKNKDIASDYFSNGERKPDIFKEDVISKDGNWLIPKEEIKNYTIDDIHYEYDHHMWQSKQLKNMDLININYDVNEHLIHLDTKEYYERLNKIIFNSDSKKSMKEMKVFNDLYDYFKRYNFVKNISDFSKKLGIPKDYGDKIIKLENVDMKYFLIKAHIFCFNAIQALPMKKYTFMLKNEIIEKRLLDILSEIESIIPEIYDYIIKTEVKENFVTYLNRYYTNNK